MSNTRLTITLPIYWNQTQTKTVLVGMNAYRNWHHFTQNKWKSDFQELVASQLNNEKIKSPYRLELTFYYKNSSCDPSNVVSLMEKAVLDALQKERVTEDDTVKHHAGSTYTVAGQDKNNPRCEITIYEV